MDCIVQGVAKSWTRLSDFHSLLQYHSESIGLYSVDFPGVLVVKKKEPAYQFRRCSRWGLIPWIGEIAWRVAWQLTPVFLPGESHRQEESGRLQSMKS